MAADPQARRRGRRAGTPRTTRRASRPGGPTTRSRPTATPTGSARPRRHGRDRPCRSRDRAAPANIEPMLATLGDQAFDDEDWLFEIKWDGYRVQAIVHEGKIRIFTRNGHDARPISRGSSRRRRLAGRRGRDHRRRGGRPRPGGPRCSGTDLAVDAAVSRACMAERTDRGRLGRGRRGASRRRWSTRCSTCSGSTADRCSASRSRSASVCSGRS